MKHKNKQKNVSKKDKRYSQIKILFDNDKGTKFIISSTTGKRVIATDGEIIKSTQLGGLVKNKNKKNNLKTDFIRKDLFSIMEFARKVAHSSPKKKRKTTSSQTSS